MIKISFVNKDWHIYNLNENSSENLATSISIINEEASSYNFAFVENDRLPGIPFLAMIPKNTNNQVSKTAKIIERTVKILNYLSDIRFPEPIDIAEVIPNGNTIPVPALIVEYIKGKSVRTAIKSNYFAKTKGEDLFDPSVRSISPINLRRVKHVLKEILNVQEDLYNKKLVHIAVVPKHIIVQIDDIVKFTGLRHICRVLNGVLDDPVITDSQNYGTVYYPRYSSLYLKQYIDSKGKVKPNVFSLVAYQIAVILFDLATRGKYKRQEFNHLLIDDADYAVDDRDLDNVTDILTKLLKGHDENRFSSYSEINQIIEQLI